jgi:hypothetical protein
LWKPQEIPVNQKTLALLVLLWPWAAANASITEVRKDFLNETSLLPATPIINAPAVNASYLICVTAGDVQATVPNAILRWTDENGEFRSFTYPTVNGVPNGCNVIRNQANTAASIETNGTYSGFYNLFAFGFGFWTKGAQSQGGLTEALSYAVTGANAGHKFSFPGYPWLFAVIAASNCRWQLSSGWSGTVSGVGAQISSAYGAGNGVFTTLTAGCDYTLLAVQFGTPVAGAGPLIDYEYNLLNWTNATYPNYKTLLTAGKSGANMVMASNIAEQPNSGGVSEQLYAYGYNGGPVPCAASLSADDSGAPAACVSAISVPANGPLYFRTVNGGGQEWGASPTYSVEVEVIQF